MQNPLHKLSARGGVTPFYPAAYTGDGRDADAQLIHPHAHPQGDELLHLAGLAAYPHLDALFMGTAADMLHHPEKGRLEIGVEGGHLGVVPVRRKEILGLVGGAAG